MHVTWSKAVPEIRWQAIEQWEIIEGNNYALYEYTKIEMICLLNDAFYFHFSRPEIAK